MAGSWGHEARLLTEREREFKGRWGCVRRGCKEAPTVMVSYRYVTGGAGRVSSNHSAVCELHAKKFATQHGIEIGPAPQEEQQSPAEQALTQLLNQVSGGSDGR